MRIVGIMREGYSKSLFSAPSDIRREPVVTRIRDHISINPFIGKNVGLLHAFR